MSENYRKPIASLNKLPQFTTMNVIDGQAGLIMYTSLIFYSLTIDNILNIIVLLILAAVSISTLTGQNGILTQANNAKTQAEIGEEKEAIGLAYNGAKTEKQGGEITADDLNSQFTKNGVNATASGTGAITVTFPDTGRNYKIKIDNNGNIEEYVPGQGISVGEKAEENTTINGEEGNYSNPTIPKGFKAVDTETAVWGTADGYQNGLVIEDATGDSTTNGSQFVWVPVENPSLFVRSYWENWSGNLAEEPEGDSWFSSCKENETTYEYTQMKNSVIRYGGFYVARYEAGITDTSNKSTQDGRVKPVSKNNTSVWNNIPWGGTYNKEAIDGYQGNDKASGAVKVARSMYPDTEKIAEYGLTETATNNTGVKSTLIYGVQWDAIMRWMKEIENISATKTPPANKYILDSTGMGNYLDSDDTNNPAATGINNYGVKNIYDMAGNVYEWTMEACSTNLRVCRGGSYGDSGSGFPASIRNYDGPGSSNSDFGFRVTLY